jgi:hypothetical protein
LIRPSSLTFFSETLCCYATADQAAPLDAALVDAALGPVGRFRPDVATAKFLISMYFTAHLPTESRAVPGGARPRPEPTMASPLLRKTLLMSGLRRWKRPKSRKLRPKASDVEVPGGEALGGADQGRPRAGLVPFEAVGGDGRLGHLVAHLPGLWIPACGGLRQR